MTLERCSCGAMLIDTVYTTSGYSDHAFHSVNWCQWTPQRPAPAPLNRREVVARRVLIAYGAVRDWWRMLTPRRRPEWPTSKRGR